MMISRCIRTISTILLIGFFIAPLHAQTPNLSKSPDHTALRVVTLNAQDIATSDLLEGTNPRLQRLAAIIQRIRPNVLLLSEIARDPQATNADRFVEHYLRIPQEPGLTPIDFNTFMPPTNTGQPSGLDLNHDGTVTNSYPSPLPSDTQGRPARSSPQARAYAGDCFGFGTYPGQYAMVLLVDPQLTINTNAIRTFQTFLWKDLPNNTPPTNEFAEPWYTTEEWNAFRLASKTFADIPITLPDGPTVHFLIAHPTPPAFDGPEGRNKHRNRDEIKLIRAYIDNDPALIDDAGTVGGLEPGALFVILGDLNADPNDGSSIGSPIRTLLLDSPKLAPDPKPQSPLAIDRLDSTDTARFRLRVDYVLPSSAITTLNTGIWRFGHDHPAGFPSDHFPVWAELAIPHQSE